MSDEDLSTVHRKLLDLEALIDIPAQYAAAAFEYYDSISRSSGYLLARSII